MFKVVVGLMHSAGDPLIGLCSHASGKKEKEGNANAKRTAFI